MLGERVLAECVDSSGLLYVLRSDRKIYSVDEANGNALTLEYDGSNYFGYSLINDSWDDEYGEPSFENDMVISSTKQFIFLYFKHFYLIDLNNKSQPPLYKNQQHLAKVAFDSNDIPIYAHGSGWDALNLNDLTDMGTINGNNEQLAFAISPGAKFEPIPNNNTQYQLSGQMFVTFWEGAQYDHKIFKSDNLSSSYIGNILSSSQTQFNVFYTMSDSSEHISDIICVNDIIIAITKTKIVILGYDGNQIGQDIMLPQTNSNKVNASVSSNGILYVNCDSTVLRYELYRTSVNHKYIDFSQIPTSNPGTTGALWREGDTLKISL